MTFQEYYTARYLVENIQDGTLERMMKYLADPRWEEVFLLTASLMDHADKFFDVMISGLARFAWKDENLWDISQLVARKADRIEGFNPAAVKAVYWFITLSQVSIDNRPHVGMLRDSLDLLRTLVTDLEPTLADMLSYPLNRAYENIVDFDLHNSLSHHNELAIYHANNLKIKVDFKLVRVLIRALCLRPDHYKNQEKILQRIDER